MSNETRKCLICGKDAEVISPSADFGVIYKCEHCRNILHFGLDAERFLSGKESGKFHACVHYHFIHYKEDNDKPYYITNKPTEKKGSNVVTVESILQHAPSNINERINSVLLNLSDLMGTVGDELSFSELCDKYLALFIEVDKDDENNTVEIEKQANAILNMLIQEGFVSLNSDDSNKYSLSYKGWQRIDEVKKQVSSQSIRATSDCCVAAPRYDVFISHASEDKKEIADKLAESLRNRGIYVWYDKFVLDWGDSLMRKINEGIANSKFGIVILSHNFFNKEWPQQELDALFNKELLGGKTILPIWHNISKSEVAKYSPLIAGKLALNTSDLTIDGICEELQKQLKRNTEDVQ